MVRGSNLQAHHSSIFLALGAIGTAISDVLTPFRRAASSNVVRRHRDLWGSATDGTRMYVAICNLFGIS
jgi:hypothetical protein